MEEAQASAGGYSHHSRNHSAATITGPLPTDSMVTVRLSDPPVASSLEISSGTNNNVIPVDGQVLGARQEANALCSNNHLITNEEAVILDDEDDSQDLGRRSMHSMTSIAEEEQSIRMSGTVRSRSDTSGSFSSNGSAQVDWDELEKSEEQAPRDEGSDEVRRCCSTITAISLF